MTLRGLVTLACALAIPRAAAADGTGVIAIGDDRGAVLAAMTGAIRDAGGARVVDALGDARAAVAAGAVPVSVLAGFRHVREQVDEGWRAYLHVKVELAASRLAAARTDAEALIALPGGAALYADASLRLGAVLGTLGRTKEAEAALALAIALDPDRPVALAEFSPDVVAAVDAVRGRAPAVRSIQVATEPAGATVSIDGKDVGRAPLAVDLALGQHVVVARLALHQSRAQAFAVGDATTNVALELDRDEPAAVLAGSVGRGMAEPAEQALVDAALEFADIDDVVVVAAVERRGGPTLLVQRCAGAPARCSAVVELGYGERSGLIAAARAAWQSVRAGDLRYPPSVSGDARATARPIAHHCELCRNPWVLAGVGTALVIGTIAVIAVATSAKPPPTVTVDPGQF